jgi:hypothetical protein
MYAEDERNHVAIVAANFQNATSMAPDTEELEELLLRERAAAAAAATDRALEAFEEWFDGLALDLRRQFDALKADKGKR